MRRFPSRLTRILPGSSTKNPFIDQIGQKLLEIGGTLIFRNLEFVEKAALDFIKGARLFQLAPDTGGNTVEAIAMAGMGIERDDLVTYVGGQQVDSSLVKRLNHRTS